MPKPTLTIGIPAYNEAQNITHLLTALLAQKLKSAQLEQILVVSDGSSDDTAELVQQIKDPRITLLKRRTRQGKMASVNTIFKQATGQVLVLLDADTLPQDEHLLNTLIQPLLKDSQVQLVGANTTSLPPRTFFERVIASSHDLKKSLYLQLQPDGDNLYLCHGRVLALARSFYQKLILPAGYPEDAYLYLKCVTSGGKFAYVHETGVLFRSPTGIRDYATQSQRFVSGRQQLAAIFPAAFVHEQYQIPFTLMAKTLLRYLIFRPVSTGTYLALIVMMRLKNFGPSVYEAKWQVAHSSKKLRG